MSYRRDWVSLAARIQGHARVAAFLLESASEDPEDLHKAIGAEILPATTDTFRHLNDYLAEFRAALSPGIVKALDGFGARHKEFFEKDSSKGSISSPAQNLRRLRAAAALLESLRVEVDHFISADEDPVFSERVERALLHLQRQLDIDADGQRSRWKKAFDEKTEVAIERLGGIHLLSHGLYGFKADPGGGRTDLILGTPPDPALLERAATPLVLTEWKKVKPRDSTNDVTEQFEAARRQLERYKRALASLELHSVCFGVIVSTSNAQMLPDETLASGVRLRWVNIAIEPTRPANPSVPLQ